VGDTHVEPLSDDALRICERCGRPVWVYPTPSGEPIALDARRGPILTEGGVARLTDEDVGYRGHSQYCARVGRARLSGVVVDAEFLWGC
jgi:hypothetical protein